MNEENVRYWVRMGTLPWQETTEGQFAEAERKAGFNPKGGTGLATAGFGGNGIQGRITSLTINFESYGFDPDFVRDVRAIEEAKNKPNTY